MKETELKIQSQSGATLAATLMEPDSTADSKPIVVQAHGFTTSRNNGTNSELAPKLAEAGIATLRFDFFGHNESTGDFQDITVTKGKQDILACIEYARNELGYRTVAVHGSSYGGATALMAASEADPQLNALVLKCPVTNYRKREDEYYSPEEIASWKEKGTIEVDHSKLNKATLGYDFYIDSANNNGWEAAKKVMCPTLIIHGDADSLVPIEDSRVAVQNFADAQLIEHEGVDHWFEEGDAFPRMINESLEFLKEKLL